jgi:hypothetical protein
MPLRGENGNSVRFTVVDEIMTMDKLRALTYDAVIKAGEENRVPDDLTFLYDFAKLWKSDGVDTMFRGAPHIVIASAPNDCSSPKEDTMIALSYFELLAVSNGLGTLWDGMFKLTLEFVAPELRKTFGIPDIISWIFHDIRQTFREICQSYTIRRYRYTDPETLISSRKYGTCHIKQWCKDAAAGLWSISRFS